MTGLGDVRVFVLKRGGLMQSVIQTDSSQVAESLNRLFDAVQKREKPEKPLTLAEWLSGTDLCRERSKETWPVLND